MTRLKLRTAVITAGFLAVSVVVANTAAGMVGAPTDVAVATAVQLPQEDPSSRTPVVEAASTATSPASTIRTPVEVRPPAIRCSDDGVCDDLGQADRRDHQREAPQAQQAAATSPDGNAAARCDRQHKPWASPWHAKGADCRWSFDGQHAADGHDARGDKTKHGGWPGRGKAPSHHPRQEQGPGKHPHADGDKPTPDQSHGKAPHAEQPPHREHEWSPPPRRELPQQPEQADPNRESGPTAQWKPSGETGSGFGEVDTRAFQPWSSDR